MDPIKSLELNRKMLDSLQEGYLLVDEDARILDTNETYCEMTGYTREELLDMDMTQISPDFSPEKQLELIQSILEKGEKVFKTRHKTKSGNLLELKAKATVIEREGKRYAAGFMKNVTEEKIAERRFKSLFEHNPLSVFYFDREGNFQAANPAFEELSGYTEEELKEKTFAPFVLPDDLERTWEHFNNTLAGEVQRYEIVGIRRNGEERNVKVTNFPRIEAGEIVGAFGIVEDITEQKEAIGKLKETEERWQRLVVHNPLPVIITVESVIRFVNRAAVKLYGADSAGELKGKSIFNFVHPNSVDEVKNRKQKIDRGESIPPSEQRFTRLDGEVREVEIHSIPIQYQGKEAVQTVIHDITERKQKEQNIKKSLDQKETLLKEVHHRVKNNLSVISGLLELQAMNADDESTLNTLRDCQQRVQSMAMIHEKLYQSEALSDISFDLYLKELIESISQTYSSESQEVDITYDLDAVSLDLEQAIPCSLIVNEVMVNCFKHAFNQGSKGKITVTSVFDDPGLLIRIKDNGKGLPEDFAIGEQQSLGMTLVQTLARQLEGEIDFSSYSGEGTTFELRFDKM